MLVLQSLYAMLSIFLSILVCAAASLFCACLVSVQVSAPYDTAGSTHELYICLFRQMARLLLKISSSSSSHFCAGQRLTPHNRTLEVRPGRITKKVELKYDYDCERDDTKSLLGVLMLGCDKK